MDVLITCKYEEDPIKNEGARVVTTLYINISDPQGQITLVLVVVSGQNLNSSKLSCMSLLPARMRMIKSKTRTVRGSDYSPAIELSEQKDKLVTATGDTEKYSEKQANKVWLNSVYWFSRY